MRDDPTLGLSSEWHPPRKSAGGFDQRKASAIYKTPAPGFTVLYTDGSQIVLTLFSIAKAMYQPPRHSAQAYFMAYYLVDSAAGGEWR